MVTPAATVVKLAELTQISEPTLTVFDRELKEAGLLTKKGRGRGSAHRTPLDMARFMVALLVTTYPSKAVEAVSDFAGLDCSNDETLTGPEELTLASLCGEHFSGPHTFEEALAAIIQGFGTQKFLNTLKKYPMTGSGILILPSINCAVTKGIISASISIYADGHDSNVYKYDFLPEKCRNRDTLNKLLKKYEEGISSMRWVSTNILHPLGEFISGYKDESFIAPGCFRNTS